MIQQPHLVAVSRRSYGRAMLAIAKKDCLHFFRYPLEALFRVVEPLIWLTPVYFLGRAFATDGGNAGFAAYAGTADYMSFILIGSILSSYVGAVFWGMGFSLKREMDSGVLESNWLAPVPRPLFLAGQTIANLLITTINSAAVLALGSWFFGFNVAGSLAPALLVMVPLLAALYGFGFAFAGLVLLLKDANTLVDVSDFLVTQLAGSQFPVRVLPRGLYLISLLLPLTYGFDAVRGFVLRSETLLPLHYEIGILVVFMGVMALLGIGFFRRVERHVRTTGTLGTH